MSVANRRVATDHELYRVFSFLSWETLEPDEATARRLRKLGGELRRLGWLPEGEELPERARMTDWKLRLWDAKAVELTDGWLKKLDAIAYPEELLVYVGLWRRVERTEEDWEGWIDSAIRHWETTFPESLRSTSFAPPDMIEHGDRPRLLGQAWVWSSEWDSEPPEGWEALGRTVYGPGRYNVFAWGLLGYHDDPMKRPDGLPRFDLHTTTELACSQGRDLCLRWELPRLLSCFLKADQFLRSRYHGLLLPTLDTVRSRLMELTHPRPAPDESAWFRTETERARSEIDAVMRHVFDFADVLTSLEVDARSVDVALDEVRRTLTLGLGRGGSTLQPWPVATLDLLARQMQTSLAYGRTTVAFADRLLQKHSIVGEIEETRAIEGLTKLGIIIMIIGAALGAMQLTTNGIARSVIFLATALICFLVYRDRVWDVWRRLKHPESGP